MTESQGDRTNVVSITIDALPFVSFALSYNGVPYVRRAEVRGLGLDVPAILSLRVEYLGNTVTRPFAVELEPDANGVAVVELPKLAFDNAALSSIAEDVNGELVAEISGLGAPVEHRDPVTIRSASTWSTILSPPTHPGGAPLLNPLATMTLASFAQPNDPAIARFLHDVRTRLEKTTGSSSTEGYQAGPDRVDAIAQAIWDEMRSRDIRYSNPPASWNLGQKVRPPREVLEGRVGTCLDTTLTLAAAFEHAGINPVLFVVKGHAFVGYMRDERARIGSVEELEHAANLVDLGAIRVLETTKVTGGASSAPFSDDAHKRTRGEFLTGDLAEFEGAIDIEAMRRLANVIPLPARHVDDTGQVSLVEYVPAQHSGHHLSAEPRAGGERAATARTPARVQAWKNSLLDLSLRNKLINFTQRSTVELAIPTGSLDHLEDLLNAGQQITLLPGDQINAMQAAQGFRYGAQLPASDLAKLLDERKVFSSINFGQNGDTYLRQFRNLAYKARTIEEETGANNLYLAVGSLVWNIDGRELKSPLVLIPVALVATGRRGLYRLQIDDAGTSTPNYCLIEKLKVTDGLVIPGLEKPIEDDHGIDLRAAFTAVREAIQAKALPYRVDETADLAILQFAKFRLWKDLGDHWEALHTAPLVQHLVAGDGEFTDPNAEAPLADLDDLDSKCPIPADASQLTAVAAAVAGRTFVLEGPPGTGKSQTITNLLTRAIADGKRVLFVAEKRAALDVVSSRLDSVGMGPFALDLHDKSSKPAVVRDQIKQALDLTAEFDDQFLRAMSEDLHSARRSLARYADRLHEPNNVGLSLYRARTQQLAHHAELTPVPVSPDQIVRLTAEQQQVVREQLRTIADVADLARPRPHHPWGFVRRPVSDAAALTNAARVFSEALSKVPTGSALGELVRRARTQQHLDVIGSIVSGPAVTLAELDAVRTRSWLDAKTAYLTGVAGFAAARSSGLSGAKPTVLDARLVEVKAAVDAAAAGSFFGRKKRILAALEPVRELLPPSLKPKEAPALIAALVQLRIEADQIAPERSGVIALRPVPGWNPLTPESVAIVEQQARWLEFQADAVSPAHGDTDFVEALRDFVAADQLISTDAQQSVRELAEAGHRLWSAAGTSPDELGRWLDGQSLADTWTGTSGERTTEVALTRWLNLLASTQAIERAGLPSAANALLDGQVEPSEAVNALDKGLAIASLEERRMATGLDQFDAGAHLKAVERFASSQVNLREALKSSIPQDVLDSRPFQSATDRGQVGALRRELGKQRRAMKVRELLETYGDLITQVMPCVLVSPDSVARFFPVGSITFDLVVFDEASQIRVADAIGALGRARSAVIVGDSKQMPPTSFAEPSDTGLAEIDEEPVPEDEESILTEVDRAGVSKLALTWHYRSKDESLIAFSNVHYYESRLSSFPAPKPGVDEDGRPVAGVSLVRVNGQFIRTKGRDRGTNLAEAEAIVDEIHRRFRRSPHDIPSIGVVTFNMPQRTLIEGMLRDSTDERVVASLDGTNGEGLFVKNLENVQGDERDVILFSTAFSKNDRGILPLNFGPLTNRGGERRLNVAITRARVQVVIYTSFDPSELRVEATQSTGIKNLREYMESAARASASLEPLSVRRVTDRHRDEIAGALRDAGLIVETDLGLSDFKVDLALARADRPDVPVVAVLLDGEGWAARRTVGDRDGLPVSVLGGLMGWRAVERVWLPEWLVDPATVIDRLVSATEKAATAPSTPLPAAPPPSPAEIVHEPVATPLQNVEPARLAGAQTRSLSETVGAAPLPGATEFTPWELKYFGDRSWLDALPNPQARARVVEAITDIVSTEGPIHLERLARLTAASFDLTRVSQARMDAIIACVPRELLDQAGFAWPADVDRGVWTGFRTAGVATARPMHEVHPLEIANAMVAVSKDAYGITEDELIRETLSLFGWKRRTEAAVAPIQSALRAAISDGLLLRGTNDLITASS